LNTLTDHFAAIRDCWITGGSAAALAPDAWQALVASDSPDETERRLLAIAGQACDVAFRPALPGEVMRRKDLPRLALPTIPEHLRALFRQALRQTSDKERNAVLRLVERRGFSAHPLDWMPAASSENVPDLYAPWQDWVQSLDMAEKDAADELDEATWDSFYPAQRCLLLKSMRRQDPARALQLITARAGQEAAEKRLALIETLAVGLNDQDAPYLQSLAGDRSDKIKTLAWRLLARLRHKGAGMPAEDMAELADFLETGSKGIFKRTATIRAKKLKSAAQASRRAALFKAASLVELSATFGITEAEFINAWQFDTRDNFEPTADACLTQMVAQSAADAFVARLGERILGEKTLPQDALLLVPRIDSGLRAQCMRKILEGQHEQLWHLARLDEGDLARSEDILSSHAYRKLKDAIKKELGENLSWSLSLLNAFAPVASAEAAKAVLEDVVSSFGLFLANPVFAFLRLNAELGNRSSKPA
jgi:hypothetical protein